MAGSDAVVRDVAALEVARVGQVEETGDLLSPFRLTRLYRELAESDSRYRPHLVWSLVQLGEDLADVGRVSEAFTQTREAIAIRRELAELDQRHRRAHHTAPFAAHTAQATRTPAGRIRIPDDEPTVTLAKQKSQIKPHTSLNSWSMLMTPFHGVDHRAPDLLQMACTAHLDQLSRSARIR